MDERTLYLLALPILMIILVVLRSIASARGRPISIHVKGFGVEMSVKTHEVHTETERNTDGSV